MPACSAMCLIRNAASGGKRNTTRSSRPRSSREMKIRIIPVDAEYRPFGPFDVAKFVHYPKEFRGTSVAGEDIFCPLDRMTMWAVVGDEAVNDEPKDLAVSPGVAMFERLARDPGVDVDKLER